MHDSYIERNNFYDYDVITNFLNIYRREQELSSISDEQRIEISIFSLSVWHKMCLNWSTRLKFKTHFVLQQQRKAAKHKKIKIFVDFWWAENWDERLSLDFLA